MSFQEIWGFGHLADDVGPSESEVAGRGPGLRGTAGESRVEEN